jgi:hypothetical protein
VTLEQEVLARVTRLLADLGIPYMIAGSLASSFHGRPRTTHDADMVIDPAPEALDRLVAELSAAHLYVDLTVAREALRGRRPFNVIDAASAFKLDLIVRKRNPALHAVGAATPASFPDHGSVARSIRGAGRYWDSRG